MLSAVVVAAILGSAAAGSAPQIAQSNSRFDSSLIKLVNGQTRQSSGKSFWDLPNNRTRFDSKEQGVTIITRYDLGKEFGISGSQCQYCPTSSTQGRYGPPPGAAYIGSTAVGSVSCDVWQNNVTLGPTVMQVRCPRGVGEPGTRTNADSGARSPLPPLAPGQQLVHRQR